MERWCELSCRKLTDLEYFCWLFYVLLFLLLVLEILADFLIDSVTISCSIYLAGFCLPLSVYEVSFLMPPHCNSIRGACILSAKVTDKKHRVVQIFHKVLVKIQTSLFSEIFKNVFPKGLVPYKNARFCAFIRNCCVLKH